MATKLAWANKFWNPIWKFFEISIPILYKKCIHKIKTVYKTFILYWFCIHDNAKIYLQNQCTKCTYKSACILYKMVTKNQNYVQNEYKISIQNRYTFCTYKMAQFCTYKMAQFCTYFGYMRRILYQFRIQCSAILYIQNCIRWWRVSQWGFEPPWLVQWSRWESRPLSQVGNGAGAVTHPIDRAGTVFPRGTGRFLVKKGV